MLESLPLEKMVVITFSNHLDGIIFSCGPIETMPKSLVDYSAI
jgi:hypothetical protein